MASLTPFISRQDLSDQLGRDVTADEGALAAVDAACDICRSIAGQSFNEVANDVLVLDGHGTDVLMLPEYPVSTVGTVKVGGEAITDYTLDTRNGLLIRTAGTANIVELTEEGFINPSTWPKGRQNVAVTYTHGYSEANLPRDVRMVALQIAARMVVQGVAQSEQVGEVQITYAVGATDLSKGEMQILSNYTRTR